MNPPQVICKALAGTGKTFTLVEGTKRRMGIGNPTIVPSSQQQAIWDTIDIGSKPSAMGFAAFNKSIKDEMEHQLDGVTNCTVLTMHSLGFAAVRDAASKLGVRCNVNKWKTKNILQDHYHVDHRTMMKNKGHVVKSVDRLTQLSKYAALVEPDDNFLTETSAYYGVEVNGSEEEIYSLTRKVLEVSKDDLANINFDDMIWLPVVNNFEPQHFDLLMVDEGQDLNHCQQQLALTAGHRIVLVGDENQAIYGFAGADTEGMSTMEKCLDTRAGGCKVNPLTITRRCSFAVVEEAKKIVPSFEAHKDNLNGYVGTIDSKSLFGMVMDGPRDEVIRPGDMMLCRTNAPLIRQAFTLIGAGIAAEIIGRDIQGNLFNLIKMLKPNSVEDLVSKVYNYEEREIRRIKLNPRYSENAVLAIEDKCACLRIFCRFAETITEVTNAITELFSEATGPCVRLSSIHRAKGLESRNVFILHPELLPHPMAKSDWEKKQESNLKYVAVTRAIENLYFVEEE